MNQTASANPQEKSPLLSVKNLEKGFPVSQGWFGKKGECVRAVSGVNLEVFSGETLGLVGESGCGKSTLARCILRLIEPDSGEVIFEGEDLLKLSPSELRKRRKNFQIIFQDPYSSLNPRMTIGQMISEPLKIHGFFQEKTRVEQKQMVEELLEAVGLQTEMARRYPHEFSGGQRQRVGIARALALRPQLIVADEPVSALDVSVQAQILNLLQKLQQEHGLSYLLIAHDLKVVERLSNRIAVMYLGKIVEEGSASDLVQNPLHPYTKALLLSVPKVPGSSKKNGDSSERIILTGDVPSPRNPPSGCAFHPRCPIAEARCKSNTPPLEEKRAGRKVACFLV